MRGGRARPERARPRPRPACLGRAASWAGAARPGGAWLAVLYRRAPARPSGMVVLGDGNGCTGACRVCGAAPGRGVRRQRRAVLSAGAGEGLKVPPRQPEGGRLWHNDGSCVRSAARVQRPRPEPRLRPGADPRRAGLPDAHRDRRVHQGVPVDRRGPAGRPAAMFWSGSRSCSCGVACPSISAATAAPEFTARAVWDWPARVGKVLIERYRLRYNTVRPQSSLGYRPSAGGGPALDAGPVGGTNIETGSNGGGRSRSSGLLQRPRARTGVSVTGCPGFVVQEMRREGVFGARLVASALRSHVVRNRNMAVAVPQHHQSEEWGPSPAEDLQRAAAEEPDEGLRARMKIVLGRSR